MTELPKRKSPRIRGYDYGTPNYYFITICTHDKKCIFGNVCNLNEFGRIAEECINLVPERFPGIRIDKYVIMPNHVHAIVIVENHAVTDISTVIGQYKMSVTKRIREMCKNLDVWQRSYHDHIIRNQKGYETIWEYIQNNPQKWEEDCFHLKEQ